MKSLAEVRILVVGDVMLDEYLLGDASRLSPEAPVPIVRYREHAATPGGAANAARNACSLGARVTLCGVAGDDDQGQELARLLEHEGIESQLIYDASRPTTVKTRVLAGAHQLARLDREDASAVSRVIEDAVAQRVRVSLEATDCILLSDYAKGLLSGGLAQAVITAAIDRGIPAVVDPKGRDFGRYRGATAITPNMDEALHALWGRATDDPNVEEVGALLMEELPGTSVVLTRGARGVTLFQPGALRLDVAANARAVSDVTGAGDTLAAVLAIAISAGLPLSDAVRLANAASGIVVGRVGTAAVTAEELTGLLEELRKADA